MSEQNSNLENDYYEDEIDLTPYIKKLLANWKQILLWAFVAAVIGFLYTRTVPRQYTVTSKISPELSYRNNSISSLASLAGINLNTLNNTDAMLPTVYPDIVNSIPFMTGLFDMPVEFTYKKEIIDTSLFVYLKDYNKGNWVGAVMNFPFMVLGKVKGFITGENKEEEQENNITAVDPFRLTNPQNAIAKAMCKMIEVTADKKTFMITLEVTMQDPVISAQVSRAVIDKLQEYVTGYRTDKARIDLEYYEKMLVDAEQDYFQSQQTYSDYMDSHQGFVLQSAKVEQQRLQNDMNLKYQLYNSVAQQVQQAEAKVQQETPVFAEILPPTVPLRKSKPDTKKIVLAFFLLGACVAAVGILLKKEDI